MTAVVPVYNAAHVLPRTVPSVLALSVDAIVYVNDGSADASADVLEALASPDPRVRIVHAETNQGRAAARNRGASGVTSDVLLFLDADVAPEAGYARAMGRALQSTEAVAAVGDLDHMDLDPRDPYHVYLQSRRSRRQRQPHGPLAWKHFISGVSAVRRDAFVAAGGFPEGVSYGEDLALGCRLAERSPVGLRAAAARARLYDVGSLDETLAKLAHFAAGLHRVVDVCPSALRHADLDVLVSRQAAGAARRALARSPRLAGFVRRTVGRLPARLQPLAVRYLLAHALASSIDPDALASSPQHS